MNITRLKVNDLFGEKNTNLMEIKDNRFILIGPNGAGKSTILNIFYYTISKQWTRLSKIDFSSIEITIDGVEIFIERDVLPSFEELQTLLRNVPSHVRTTVSYLISNGILKAFLENGLSQEEKQKLLKLSNIEDSELVHLKSYLRRRFSDDRLESYTSNFHKEIEKINKINIPKILYLPTYRRIEKDLSDLLYTLDEDDRERFSLRFKEQLGKQQASISYKELVEFGMSDIQGLIGRKGNKLKDFARTAFNELAGSYLSDVINGIEPQESTSNLAALDLNNLNYILGRFDNKHLNLGQKQQIVDFVNDLKAGSQQANSAKAIHTLHFLKKLYALVENVEAEEKDVKSFVDTVNSYFYGKEFVFDNNSFNVSVISKEKEVKLDSLSSGEKQIVSLFAELYLSEEDQYFVIIDEPELSLSVSWQEKVLTDVCASKKCVGLATVTHSPFVFENDLDQYVLSMDRR